MNWLLLISLTLKSILNRKLAACLTVLSISVSVLLILSVETVRTEAKSSFTNTVSGTDLLVGARSGSVQLLLYSVFRIGNATNNIDWKSYQEISSHSSIEWAIPISLGDSHKGFRVMGTTQDYFEFYRYGAEQQLEFASGRQFEGVYDVVIGSEVAKGLAYNLDDQLILSHGIRDTHFSKHDDKPFKLVGVLEKTGTPVDRTIHVSLEGIEALHIDWQSGARVAKISADDALDMDLEPKQITAFMIGLKSKMALFSLQRAINNYRKEPLLAILPGIALGELWQLIGVAEKALLAVSIFVLFNSFVGLLTVLLTSLNERRREIAILRSMGARPKQIFTLLALESTFFGLLGCVSGVVLYYLALVVFQPVLQQILGLQIPIDVLSEYELSILGLVLLSSMVLGAFPGFRAYRNSLSDGMSVRL